MVGMMQVELLPATCHTRHNQTKTSLTLLILAIKALALNTKDKTLCQVLSKIITTTLAKVKDRPISKTFLKTPIHCSLLDMNRSKATMDQTAILVDL
jgi:hypothetical protein